MKKRCLFGIADDLQDYAERVLSMLDTQSEPIFSRCYGPVTSSLIHREFVYQTELVEVRPNTVLPTHRHPLVDSIECPISGFMRFTVDGRDPYAGVSDERLERFAIGKLLRIGGSQWHSGRAGARGAQFLSMQRWPANAPYGLIGERWEGKHVSGLHAGWARNAIVNPIYPLPLVDVPVMG